MAAEYNQDQSTGLRSELDEPRRTTDQVKSGDLAESQPDNSYFPTSTGGGSEDEPPQHKIHTEDEPLPKPKSGTYDDELSTEKERTGSDELAVPAAKEETFEDAPQSTESNENYRESEPSRFDESPETKPRSFGAGEQTNGGYADPSSAFPGAPVDRTTEEPGYGQEQKSSEPVAPLDSAHESGTGTPKKEGFITKIKEKLPGHHKTATTPVDDDTSAAEPDTTAASPKKGLITKIKEKLPGHHGTPTHTPTE